MGIFFDLLDNSKVFNEIEAVDPNKREDNSTANVDQNTERSDNPADAPEDYTVPDEGEDQSPEEADQNASEEGTEAGGDPIENEEYTSTDGDEGGDPPPEGEEGGDPEGDETSDYTDDSGYDDDGGTQSDDEIRQLEDEIFSKFNSPQLVIMSRTLKTNYNKLFSMLDDLVDKINEVPKAMEYIKLIEFVSNKLADLRDMISDYLYYTYDTKSYVENEIAYKRFLITTNQINELIAKIASANASNNRS